MKELSEGEAWSLALVPTCPRLALTGLRGVSGASWVPMHLSSVLLAKGIPSSILSRNKNPALPPQCENKPYFLLWQNQNFTAGGGEDLGQVCGPQPEPAVGSAWPAWPCLGIPLGVTRPERQVQ